MSNGEVLRNMWETKSYGIWGKQNLTEHVGNKEVLKEHVSNEEVLRNMGSTKKS